MALLRTLAGSLLALSLTAPLQAASLIETANPEEVSAVLHGFGSIEREEGTDGTPQLIGRIDGTRYGVYFYSCDDGKANCNEIQFSAGWSNVEVSLAQINSWNRDKRYCKAYLDGEGDPMLELDVNMRFGISKENLADTVEYWQLCLNEFSKELSH